ncbi:MAG: phosphoenolpyruvate--protein phosphotransferase [Acidiferrobacteraceae bacterium]|jgi:phosphotransferase system enzyme I (PtsI)|nr:phosphoenolpyruvate--protein phosphotransferase [Acidiferrobacteraceae bacterium]MDP6551361.1 phosphoenolpyruvate--protein phosphotransferase [Arenicellales bacterium]MDP6792175.1 phosphoenolpyruvate--protein phosphotransferase [Arenicellales bacterium]MDP6919929.1 phosphoenolpyruvate--protein phosphotransferase [Arenicellales bacterium]|tara:strand:+ start:5177 stop:6928 length:1752 start_codon:yes stop_codon:yes gene_type:complete
MLALSGTGIGRGIAIGRALILDGWQDEVPHFQIDPGDVDQEVSRFNEAIASVRLELRHLQAKLPPTAPPETGAFIDVHLLMLDDPLISHQPAESIENEKINAEWALKNHADTLVAFFDNISDPYLRTKKEDVTQVVGRIMDVLTRGEDRRRSDVAGLDQALNSRIIVARDLSPADTVMLRHRNMTAFVTRLGGPISHTAILARSLGLTAVVGLHRVIDTIRDGDQLIVDAATGTVLVSPDDRLLAQFQALQQRQHAQKQALAKLGKEKAVTRDNEEITLLANIELPEDLDALDDSGAAGVGLYRTEFLFMNRTEPPEEEEQYQAYCHVLNSVHGPVTIRTLDLGADKQVDGGRAEPTAAMTAALGLRAIRLCLSEPSLFKPQLRAILRAAVHGDARLMIPMLSSLQELEQSLALIREVCAELEREGAAFDPNIPVGGMIEVPAAAISADLFAQKLDFFSIGTNDLIQYTLAIDRVDDSVNYLYDPLHPSVLRLVHNVIQAGSEAGIPVSMCGEMAGDPDFTRLLLGLGLRQFSMEPSRLLEIRQQVRDSRLSRLPGWAERILECADSTSLHGLVDQLNAEDCA